MRFVGCVVAILIGLFMGSCRVCCLENRSPAARLLTGEYLGYCETDVHVRLRFDGSRFEYSYESTEFSASTTGTFERDGRLISLVPDGPQLDWMAGIPVQMSERGTVLFPMLGIESLSDPDAGRWCELRLVSHD